MTKWHAYVVHMAKYMNMVGGPFGGSPGPRPLAPLNPSLGPRAMVIVHFYQIHLALANSVETPYKLHC